MKPSRPIGRKNYGSIPHLSNSKLGDGDYLIGEGQEQILTLKKRDKHDIIIVSEKYDGSNVGVAKHNNKIYALTRSGYEAATSPYKQLHMFAEFIAEREPLFYEMLSNGERITGEWMAQAHGLQYKITRDPIVFFDYFDSKNERLTHDKLIEKAIKYNLQLPRCLHIGNSVKVEDIRPVLKEKTKSIESIGDPEGMVYRVERHGKVDFLAKWVRNDFHTGQFCINIEEQDLIYNIDHRSQNHHTTK